MLESLKILLVWVMGYCTVSHDPSNPSNCMTHWPWPIDPDPLTHCRLWFVPPAYSLSRLLWNNAFITDSWKNISSCDLLLIQCHRIGYKYTLTYTAQLSFDTVIFKSTIYEMKRVEHTLVRSISDHAIVETYEKFHIWKIRRWIILFAVGRLSCSFAAQPILMDASFLKEISRRILF